MRSGAAMVLRWTWLLGALVACSLFARPSAGINPRKHPAASVCDLDPCACERGTLVCDCTRSPAKEISLTAEALEGHAFSAISVSRCARLRVGARALEGLAALRRFAADGIGRLELEEGALRWTAPEGGLAVNITHSGVPTLPSHCFGGALSELRLASVHVSGVRAFAFGGVERAEKIVLDGVRLDHVESQAFKKIGVDFLVLNDVRTTRLPRRTMTHVEVREETLVNNLRADVIESGAIALESKTLRILRSAVGRMERLAFLVRTRGDVSVHDNAFGLVESEAFVGIGLDGGYLRLAGKQELVFENNTLADFQSGALTFDTTGLDPVLDRILVDRPCSCDGVKAWSADLVVYSSEGSSPTNPQAGSVVFCSDGGKLASLKDYESSRCGAASRALLAIVVAAAASAAVALGAVVYCRRRRTGKRYVGVATAPPKPGGPNKKRILVVPDGKTYQETELHVIVERAESIVPTEYVQGLTDKGEQPAA